jgi:PilZ domain
MREALSSTTPEYSTGRRHVRHAADFPVRLFLLGDSKEIAGRSGDISIAGVCFYAPVKLAVGRLIRLQFCLPHSTLSFDVSAVIKDAEGFRYGAEFTKISNQERKEVERVCRILSLKAI